MSDLDAELERLRAETRRRLDEDKRLEQRLEALEQEALPPVDRPLPGEASTTPTGPPPAARAPNGPSSARRERSDEDDDESAKDSEASVVGSLAGRAAKGAVRQVLGGGLSTPALATVAVALLVFLALLDKIVAPILTLVALVVVLVLLYRFFRWFTSPSSDREDPDDSDADGPA